MSLTPIGGEHINLQSIKENKNVQGATEKKQ